ncbi:MAG: hypothetical protein H6519_06315 [Microthrixaceae bacterium]|nr:hypothetical protein [Acidimicrobiales bacterium]MCB9404034.1 hypothetical protein [Microthrixaceae bacterium]
MTSAAPGWRVATALAPGEARRIARSVAFLMFMPLWVATARTAATWQPAWPLASIEVAVGLVPLGWCLLVLTNLATLRDRRHGVDVICDTLPASTAARTGGHLLGGLVGVPFAVALLIVWSTLPPDRVGDPDLAELVVPLLLVAGGAVLGVATARWLPWAFMTVPVIGATIFITGKIGEARISRTRFLGFIANPHPSGLSGLEVRPTLLHLVWLLAWTAMMAMVALLRHNRGRAVVTATSMIGVVIVVTGIGQLRAVDPTVAMERADLLNRPERHQRCVVDGTVTYCGYPETDQHRRDWQTAVGAVLVQLPVEVRDRPLVVSQRVPYLVANSNCGTTPVLEHLDSPIAEAVSLARAWSLDGAVHPSVYPDALPCSEDSLNGLFTAMQVGSWAVGLPPSQWGEGERCHADGQARSAIALWLSTVGGGRLGTFLENADVDGAGRVDVTSWNTQPTVGVAWHESDVKAALAMADLPVSRVAGSLKASWDELTAASTPTSAVLDLLGLPSIEAPAVARDQCPAVTP